MRILIFFLLPFSLIFGEVKLGIDRFFTEGQDLLIKKKRVGLVTNHTGVNAELTPTAELFKKRANLTAIFTPEHGLNGAARAAEKVRDQKQEIPIYSLHGETRRPTKEMLQTIDVLVFDIQEIGCRSYTYVSTLFYVMEEAAIHKIPVIVLDRPNPMGGLIVDGPMLEQKWRSFVGYVNVPYCHGMTVGELAQFFNAEYKVGCKLHVVPMTGWTRKMTYKDTGLTWIPTSPYIPESDTPFYYASTGILGALGIVNIGIGYTLPFKVVGAPWLDAKEFALKLNAQKLPGVRFLPFYYKPFYGKFQNKECQGVQIVITDVHKYRPLAVQYMLIGMLKSMHPTIFNAKLRQMEEKDKILFSKVNGTDQIIQTIEKEPYIAWKLIGHDKEERAAFLQTRKKYLIYE